MCLTGNIQLRGDTGDNNLMPVWFCGIKYPEVNVDSISEGIFLLKQIENAKTHCACQQ